MTFSSLPLYIQSPWTVSISLCQVSCCPRQWCSSSWLFDANSTVSPWFKLRDPENVCLVNIDRVGQLSSGKSHLSALCSIVHFFSFSSDSQQSGILIPWIWSANHVHSSAPDFPLQNFQLFVALNNSVNCKDSTSKLYRLFLLPMPDTFVQQIWTECLY